MKRYRGTNHGFPSHLIFSGHVQGPRSIMGCINSKLVPEVPENHGRGPEVIATLNLPNQSNDEDAKKKQKKADPNTNPKVKKYRAKFDHRVTAKYDIKALIGRGSFSRVVRVEHKITKQPYAIKMIDRIQGKDLFESELSVLRRVKHAYIIQLIEVFEAKDKVYMVMELATGGELFDRIISKGSFMEKDAVHVLRMVLDGIKYLHALGITHRDLKPENLLYYHPGADSKIMITDFGLSATVKASEPFMKTTCGTPEYIAPEILARKPYTNKVDMWAVGVVAYILLSGNMPFDEENRTRLYRLILRARFNYDAECWKDISPLAKDFINKILMCDPAERLSAVACLKHSWISTNASGSSNKNLHRTISHNLLHRHSTRNNSIKSSKSTRSAKSTRSNRSNKSAHSLRSEHKRVDPDEIDKLLRDPEVRADIESIGGDSCR